MSQCYMFCLYSPHTTITAHWIRNKRGRGGFTAIGNFNLLRADQVPALANGDRLPIVTHQGELVGMLTVRDLVRWMARELGLLGS